MEVNEQLIRTITQAVVEQLHRNDAQPQAATGRAASSALAGRTRIRPKHSYEGVVRAVQGTDPKEIVIGVGAAFQTEIKKTLGGLPLDEVLRNVKAGIEEEGMVSRVVKVLDTSDVGFMALQAAKLSVPDSESESSQKEQQSFIKRICIPFPIWNCFPRRL